MRQEHLGQTSTWYDSPDLTAVLSIRHRISKRKSWPFNLRTATMMLLLKNTDEITAAQATLQETVVVLPVYGTGFVAHQAAENVQNPVVTLAIVFTCIHLRWFFRSVHRTNPACPCDLASHCLKNHCCSLLSCPGAWAVKNCLPVCCVADAALRRAVEQWRPVTAEGAPPALPPTRRSRTARRSRPPTPPAPPGRAR